MNPYTGHLVATKDGEALPADYEAIPAELLAEAWRTLGGRDEAQVNLRSNTPLAQWAKKKRKAKIAAASRRRNRHGKR